MKKTVLLSGLLAGALLCGCAHESQKMVTTTVTGTNGVITITRTTQGKVFTVIQSKQSIADIYQQNGAVQASGAKGLSQEATGDAFVNAVAAGVVTGLKIAGTGGVGALIPNTTTTAPATVPAYDPNDRSTWPNKVVNLGNGTAQVCWPNGACIYGVPLSTATNLNIVPK